MVGSSNGEWRPDPTGRFVHRWWDGLGWTDLVSSVAGVTGVDPAPIGSADYTGPIPSPAGTWAPWVITTSAVCAFGTAIVCVLDLVERHYQQQRLTARPPSVERIHNTIQTIHAVSNLTFVAAIAFGVVVTIWGVQRRSKARLKQGGESAVEPALRKIDPTPLFHVMCFMPGVSVFLAVLASASTHPGMTIHDVVTYRTLLAVGAAARVVMWVCWIPFVARATRIQAEREGATRSPVAA